MTKGLLFIALCLASVFPSVLGSATLVADPNTATCRNSGHISQVIVTSVTCNGSTMGCTYGQNAMVSGRFYSDADIPRPMIASATLYGVKIGSREIVDILDEQMIQTASSGGSVEYPSAGMYNFHFNFTIPGNENTWYNAWMLPLHVGLHIKHEGGGRDFAACFMTVKSRPSTGYFAATAVSSLGVAGLLVTLYAKRRKERVAQSEDDSERGTNFELVQDGSAVV